jgi:hypothetical protein
MNWIYIGAIALFAVGCVVWGHGGPSYNDRRRDDENPPEWRDGRHW